MQSHTLSMHIFRYFSFSALVTFLGFAFAGYWAHRSGSSISAAMEAVLFLGALEVALSFDNAIVNAKRLEKMSEKWRVRFLTWGILIAVFGTRFLFPILLVCIFAHTPISTVLDWVLNDTAKYEECLHMIHAPLVSFGGAFLFMLFFHYFLNPTKDAQTFWIRPLERKLSTLGRVRFLPGTLTCLAVAAETAFVEAQMREEVFLSGIAGVACYALINFFVGAAENSGGKVGAGFAAFAYLELIDTSFSLDGVLGAFAITKDVVIMSTGLAIGAMFVRSFTVYMVERRTLKSFAHLESGAHWAVGALATAMFISASAEIPEAIAGLSAMVIILSSLATSMLKKRRDAKLKKTRSAL